MYFISDHHFVSCSYEIFDTILEVLKRFTVRENHDVPVHVVNFIFIFQIKLVYIFLINIYK